LGIGGNLPGLSRNIGIDNVAKICNIPDKEDSKNICIEGAISSLVARYGGINEIVVKFCQSTTENIKELCFVDLNYLAKNWGYSNNKIAEICSFAKDHQLACLGQSKLKPTFN
jgi:hypothetical protein